MPNHGEYNVFVVLITYPDSELIITENNFSKQAVILHSPNLGCPIKYMVRHTCMNNIILLGISEKYRL